MSATVPERLQVGPFSFVVSTDPSDVADARRNANDGRLGETDTVRLRMAIDADVPPDQIRDTLLHELLHAVVWTTGGWREGTTDEQAIRQVSSVLLDALRRNPALVAYLIDA